MGCTGRDDDKKVTPGIGTRVDLKSAITTLADQALVPVEQGLLDLLWCDRVLAAQLAGDSGRGPRLGNSFNPT